MEDAGGIRWPRLLEIAVVCLVLAASSWSYRGAFRCFFVQDDFAWLIISRFNTLWEYANCFLRFNPAGTFRPLSQETFFWLGQRVFGLWPPGFHIIIIAAHGAAVLLLYFLLRRFSSPLPSLVGACLYAVHGAHVTSLYWISAFPEPLAMVFLLAAVLMFVDFDRKADLRAYAFSLAAMLLGIMAKESTLALPLILAAYCILRSRSRLLWTLPYFAVAGTYMLFRLISRIQVAPYDLSLGRQTLESFCAYLSWMAGFSEYLVRSSLRGNPAMNYPWVALGFIVVVFILFMVSRDKRVAGFALLWMVCGLQPVLYFSNHIYSYYLAPALAGLSLLIASALPPLRDFADWRRWTLSLAVAGGSLGLSHATIHPEGDWWIGRASARRLLIDRLLDIDRRVPAGETAYIVGLKESEFENLEGGSVFRAFNLPMRKFRFLLPELDGELRLKLEKLAGAGALSQAHCYIFSADEVVDQTEAFRGDPGKFLAGKPIRFLEMAGVRLDAGPEVIYRGKDSLELRTVNLGARTIDLLYSIDGQMMPPVLQWRLNAENAVKIFADMATPEGDYYFHAVRESGADNTRWIKIDARVTVR